MSKNQIERQIEDLLCRYDEDCRNIADDLNDCQVSLYKTRCEAVWNGVYRETYSALLELYETA